MNSKYDFYGRLTKAYPSQIVVDVTQVCNLSCAHCPHGEYAKSSSYEGIHLSERMHDKLIADVARNSLGCCEYLRYTGEGEPLTHPLIFEFLKDAKEQTGVTISLTTNGTLLTAKAREKIFDADVDIIDISIDALSSKTYGQIRRGGNRDKVYQNVLDLIQEKKQRNSGPRIVTTFIEQDLNRHETAEFQNFWQKSGADYVIIRRLHSNAGANSDIAKKLRARNKERRPCLYPWERLVITPDGHISYCPAAWDSQASFATLEETDIADAWQGKFMQKARQSHLDNDYSSLPFCGQCPDWQCTRWPFEGRSFADMVLEFKESEK